MYVRWSRDFKIAIQCRNGQWRHSKDTARGLKAKSLHTKPKAAQTGIIKTVNGNQEVFSSKNQAYSLLTQVYSTSSPRWEWVRGNHLLATQSLHLKKGFNGGSSETWSWYDSKEARHWNGGERVQNGNQMKKWHHATSLARVQSADLHISTSLLCRWLPKVDGKK